MEADPWPLKWGTRKGRHTKHEPAGLYNPAGHGPLVTAESCELSSRPSSAAVGQEYSTAHGLFDVPRGPHDV